MLRLVIPLIIIFIIAGAISFSLAFTYYPKKNVNVNVDGICYEILGPAYADYTDLEAERELRVLAYEYNAIEEPNAIIPILYTGTKGQVQDFISKYNARVTDNQEIGGEMYYTKDYIGKTIIKGEISKANLLKVISDLSSPKRDSNENVLYNLGIQTNAFLSSEEKEKISSDSTNFMFQGIQKILENRKDSIKQAECRNQIQV
ncbi:hypothetical protein [Candidatus Nitrosocosmicus arcticus]|uniref:Uncharacterized protein n=1 Tax=Candidatus Nitrosocosmicus arcticus TaxID=2035267 RepID=A0A557STU3_9ARCH|nr:hypothetical protein [Candidatus Nitrosocosmicus arcticus]TVP40026.1 hypothetical protein NARC_100088 [Candidatus Nitrosocosmicus arcticus]